MACGGGVGGGNLHSRYFITYSLSPLASVAVQPGVMEEASMETLGPQSQPRQRLDINHNIGQAQYYIITLVKGAMYTVQGTDSYNQNVFQINHLNFLNPSECILIQCWSQFNII